MPARCRVVRRAVLAAALCALLAASAARAALPPDFFGIAAEDVWSGDAAYRDAMLRRQAGDGIGLDRQVFNWGSIEKSPGSYDWGWADGYVAALAQRGMRILPIILGAPSYDTTIPPDAPSGTYPPDDPSKMGPFAAALVRRYGPSGSFWSAHPSVPKLPIRAWQIWNEPNLPVYWPKGPDPAAYTRLLSAAASAIRGVDPGAEIVTAGLPESRLPGAIPVADFLAGMYDAGAAGSFDDFALHGYASDDERTLQLVRDARAVIAAHSDDAPIWLTEFGWASDGPGSRFTGDESDQAQRVRCALTKLTTQRDTLGIRGLVYYDWIDQPPVTRDWWALHVGLLHLDETDKPAASAFRDTAQAARAGTLSGPVACLSVTPETGQIIFTHDAITLADTSVDPSAGIVDHSWDLDGDGQFGDASGTTVTTSYPVAGFKTVRLRVTDAAGATAEASTILAVHNRPPVASFSVSPAEPAAGQAAKLTSTSSDADGVVTAVAWDLDGDGTYEATGPSVTKTFPAPGTYTIGVRATDDGKESSTASGQVTVGPPLPPGAAGAGLVRRNPDRSRLRCRWLHLGWHRYRYCAAPRKAHRRAARRHARHARRHAAR